MKAITPAPSAPAISRKVVKSGITSAIPVTTQITSDRITTDFIFFIPLVPVLKKGFYSAMSKAARICKG